jgi:sulfonate transport system permease protein
MVTIPASLPYLFAAARLTVPRALLGVMIAEWLATGKGLGNLLNQSRGYLDYGMIWTVAAVSVMLSVLFYQTRRAGRAPGAGPAGHAHGGVTGRTSA